MTDKQSKPKMYKLIDADGQIYESPTPGEYGGNRKSKIYGRLDCSSANRALKDGYASIHVFFADEETAIKAGY